MDGIHLEPYLLLQLLVLHAHVASSQTTPQARITIYIMPTASTTVFVNCWSNNTNLFQDAKNFTYIGEFSWTRPSYSSSTYDVFWCRARMGNSILLQFPVYGGGVERNSSEWLINSRGKRRLSLNSNFTDDQRGIWIAT